MTKQNQTSNMGTMSVGCTGCFLILIGTWFLSRMAKRFRDKGKCRAAKRSVLKAHLATRDDVHRGRYPQHTGPHANWRRQRLGQLHV